MASNADDAPASTVASLTVGESGIVSEADQQAAAVTISGTLSAALPSGDAVQVQLPSGVLRQATVASDGTDFSLVLSGGDTIAFGIPGQVSAFVVDPGGNQGTAFTETFTAAAARTLLPVTSTASDFAASGASALALSGDGKSVAYVANQTVGNAVQFGLYVQRLDTGVLTLVDSAGRAPSLSADGNLVAYQANVNFTNQVFLKDLTTGLVTQLSDPVGGSTSGVASTRPSIANDGTVVFESAGDTALHDYPYQQVFIARVSGGVATRTLVSAAADDTPGNGDSEYATISADGSTIVFLSDATNLLSPGDPHAAALNGTFQIYALALRDNPASGQRAGTTVLVSVSPDGAISDGTDYNLSVSGDGRFVLYQSVDGNSQLHLIDLLTGASRIVSTNADGDVANAGAFGAALSADGNTVVFQSAATNLLAPGGAATDLTHSQQVFAKNLTTGQVALLSEGGYTPADAVSQDPTVSADGTVAAFASTADNLTPGVLGSTNRYPTSRGYVTALASAPALAVNAPAEAAPSSTVVLTGTIDPAHATTPIILTDAADPGFLPVTAVVTSGSDPYADTWTATVIFTQAGPQTVTAAAGTATAQADVTLLNASPLTIDKVNGDDAITATSQSGHVTTVTGANPGAPGSTVSLFLRTADGKKLGLGAAITGADGRWSISVPDSALGIQSSESDALVAETVDASGATIRAGQAVALTIVPPVVLYGYRFTYTDGSFYTGTVADDGTYGYAPGETITTSAGQYAIGDAAGATTQAGGTVTAASYFDVSTSASYTPAAAAAAKGATDGAGGLGSETDTITGPGGTQSFGAGVTEARQSTATVYGFGFVYNDGSAYYGTVVGGASSGYQAGQTLKKSGGYYKITGSLGASTAAVGTVSTSLYYDAGTAATYTPVSSSLGQSSGLQGLGSEVDMLSTASGAVKFGLAGVDEAAFKLVLSYSFDFTYLDGSFYAGYVVDDGTHDYSLGKIIKTPYGQYIITSVSAIPVLVGGNVLTPGQVSVSVYYDRTTNANYVPGYYAEGFPTGLEGLGTESDYTDGISGHVFFGYGGLQEAKQEPNKLFSFTFTYKDGSAYYGSVVDDGSYGYYTGETITTAYGHYSITYGTGLKVGEGGLVAGDVYTRNYFDITSGGPYVTLYQNANLPSGTKGLLSESDAVLDPTGVYRTFGYGGQYEAKLTPYILVSFSFDYTDGSNYTGDISSDGVHGPLPGQIIKTSYGYYDVYAYDGATALTPGTVTIYHYHDVTDGNSYTPHSFSGNGTFGANLGTAVGYLDGPLLFGYSGEYEARHAPFTSWEYQFIYTDGSSYVGDVVDNGQSGFHPGFIEKTPYGYYNITGSTQSTALPIGSVTIRSYYDVTTGKVYDPVDEGSGGIDGTAGLDSEYADTRGPNGDLQFGFGGQYEAKQSDVRHYSFTFRYDDGSFYSGEFSSAQNLYLAGTILHVAGGYYNITALTDEQSSLPSGEVTVSSYFDIATGKFYTPVRYAEGKYSGTTGLGSELDYIVAGFGLNSFGGPSHHEANTAPKLSLKLTTSYFAFDGPIQGATVGYLNPAAMSGTLSIDPAQPTTTTNADGSYQLDAGSGPLVLTGGTDTATGLAFKGTLESAGTGSVLSPVTTLLEAVAVARGDTSLSGITAAETLLSTALGLPAELDLTTYAPGEILRDPTTSPNDIPVAETVYRAGAKLLDIETLIDAAGGNSHAAIDTMAAALAHGSVNDLTDLSPLIEDGVLPPQAETAIKAIVGATNAALDQQLAGVTVPAAILALISGASIALQGDAATALAAANADDAAVAKTYVQTLSTTLQADDEKAFGVSVPCYCPGTAILTDCGEIAVEHLQMGDRVITGAGAPEPVHWIGRRHYSGAFVAGNHLMLPVCIKAGALADNVPRRDLRVSPGHAMFVDGQLVPAWRLVNGVSVTQADAVESVAYYHVELGRHAVLLAEGAPAESFLDDGCRGQFHNAAEFDRLYPDAPPMLPLQPRLEDGFGLQAIQERIANRAGVITPAAPVGALRGFIDMAIPARICGWAQDADSPEAPVALEVLSEGRPVLCLLANAYRADLRQAGFGSGCHSFDMALPAGLTGQIEVRRIADGAYLAQTLAARDSGHADRTDCSSSRTTAARITR